MTSKNDNKAKRTILEQIMTSADRARRDAQRDYIDMLRDGISQERAQRVLEARNTMIFATTRWELLAAGLDEYVDKDEA